MSRLISFLLIASGLVLANCSDDGTTEPVEPTLAEELDASSLPPGNWRVENGGNSVCIRTFTAPGNVTATESIGMSGFGTFELRLSESETLTLRGTTDELEASWTGECVEFDASQHQVFNLENCNEELGCPPFDLVRLCGNQGEPTFFARVPDCGQSTFPAVAQ